MVPLEETPVDRFITRRMLRYCKEAGLNYFESVHALHLKPQDREQYETDWLETAGLE